MSVLFDETRHETLTPTPWSEQGAAQAIERISADFVAARQPDGTWPTHPREDLPDRPHFCQYNGAAGAVVTLRALRARTDFADSLPEIYRRFLDSPDHGPEPGLQIGEIGILSPSVLAGVATPSMLRRMDSAMEACLTHPAMEITAGVTGMMHAALTLYEGTGDARWLEHFLRGADVLVERRLASGEFRGLWRSDVFGITRHYYGACHGLAGNVGVLVRGRKWLDISQVETMVADAVSELERAAIGDERFANWTVSADTGGERRLVQWCHGAAGVVTSLACCPRFNTAVDDRLESLLTRAADLVWHAGPLAKSPGICHGTPGNGFAMLAMYRRSKNSLWLDRARAFAMHSIEQAEREKKQMGQRRFTLWTGDGGLAVFLQQCLQAHLRSAPTDDPKYRLDVDLAPVVPDRHENETLS